MKFCYGCKHFDSARSDCARPASVMTVSLVTGKPLIRTQNDAWYERYNEGADICGKDAKFFEWRGPSI